MFLVQGFYSINKTYPEPNRCLRTQKVNSYRSFLFHKFRHQTLYINKSYSYCAVNCVNHYQIRAGNPLKNKLVSRNERYVGYLCKTWVWVGIWKRNMRYHFLKYPLTHVSVRADGLDVIGHGLTDVNILHHYCGVWSISDDSCQNFDGFMQTLFT